MTAASESIGVYDEALALLRGGYRLFPVHTVVGGRCTCGHGDCVSAGKHPRTRDGHKATVAMGEEGWEAAAEEWWGGRGKWRQPSNVGVATGNGLLVIDIDPGKAGDDSWDELLEDHEGGAGGAGGVVEVVTGGGGRHLYYRVGDGRKVPCSVGRLGRGVDVRGDGGYVVGPGSRHASGRLYAWEGQGEVVEAGTLPEAPAWLLQAARGKREKAGKGEGRERGDVGADAFVLGERNVLLTKMAGVNRRKGNSSNVIFTLLKALNTEKCRPPLDEREVLRVAQSVCRYEPADPILCHLERTGRDEVEAGEGVAGDWRKALALGAHGEYRAVPGNAVLLMTHDTDWAKCITWDSFGGKALWGHGAPEVAEGGMRRPSVGEELRDGHAVYAQQWLLKTYGILLGKDAMVEVLCETARHWEYHVVRDWLRGLKWDGAIRGLTWLTDYFGVEGGGYASEVGRAWLVSAVARVMKPGCQTDHVLVLEGPQGAGKSTVMQALFGSEWYLGALPDIRNKDALLALRGKWGIEIGELDAIRGASASKVKDFLTQRVDEYRSPYGRLPVVYPRQCVFVGTTNEERWMTDATGGRRFWPVRVRKIDRDGVAAAREQLWAEAVARYDSGEKWWPSPETESMFAIEQEERYDVDAWEDAVARFVEHRQDRVSAEDVLTLGVGVPLKDITRSDQTRVGTIMTRLGWSRKRLRESGSRTMYYVRAPWRMPLNPQG